MINVYKNIVKETILLCISLRYFKIST